MNKLLSTLFALSVACATSLAQAQTTPAAGTPEAAAASAGRSTPAGAKSVEAKAAMCIGCHGIVGYQASFPEVHKVPKISGQSAKYIASALNAYKTGDRKHPTMRSIAESLTEQDINDIAAWYESHGNGNGNGKQAAAAKPVREPNAQVTALLQKAACASCHGANFANPIDPSYPTIAGQHADYLFVALKAYKTENNATVGRNNGVMGAIAKQYSNSELKALANYMASLESELTIKPEPRFR